MRQILILIILLFYSLVMFAQESSCGSNIMTDLHLDANKSSNDFYKQDIEESTLSNVPNGIVYTIPVVFHILHNTNSENVSSTVIQDMFNTINKDYRKINSEFNNPPRPDFLGVASDVGIEFCLATIDDNGNILTEPGITRTQTNVTAFDMEETNVLGIPEEAMKFTSKGGKDAFDPDKYLNIWICDLLQASAFGGVAGYTIFPLPIMVGSSYDGIVLDYQIGLSGRSITHEIGHYFGLYHPWGNAANDPNCVDDDGILDTPETDGANYLCNYNASSCSSLDMVENFMDYSTCPWMFTVGQKTVMHSLINSLRSSLLSSSSCGEVSVIKDSKKDLIFYPNPTKGYIKYLGENLENFMIFDLFGNKVFHSFSGSKIIDVSHLVNGIYTIIYRTSDSSTYHQKIVMCK